MTATESRKVVKVQPQRQLSPWTSKQLDELRRVAPLGTHAAAEILGRTIASVQMAAHRHGISLRATGNRAGRILGQPNGSSWSTARTNAEYARLLATMRADLREGRLALPDLDRALNALEHGAELCPQCTKHVIDVPSEGICTSCHRIRLAAAHDAAIDAHRSQRILWDARQSKVRRKRREAKETP
jgi:hypothetical protein